ncbi:MAG: hypothetical protein NWE93_11350 [Candidatus Bathyarchaeota archaeon]|nr:hypothetical protein [Candidatus Bathyarchaeota archaeon]
MQPNTDSNNFGKKTSQPKQQQPRATDAAPSTHEQQLTIIAELKTTLQQAITALS